MEQQSKQRKMCGSWYHRSWFRIILAIVAIDMIVLGVSLIFGFDFLGLLGSMNLTIRIIGGVCYILTASFILHYIVSYRHFRRKHTLVCPHCVEAALENKEE